MPFLALHGPAGTTTPPVRIRYRTRGPSAPTPSAPPPVLLVHGAGGSSASWLSTMPRLVRAGAGPARRVVAFDLPGHGRSTGTTDTVDDWLAATGGTAATLCLGRAVLVGHSLGGLIALAAALAFPDKVAGLVLVTTAAALNVSPRLLEGLASDWAHWPERLERLAYSPDTPVDVRRRSVGHALGADQAQTVRDFSAAGSLDLRARLGEVACPTLVVVGEHDLMIPPKHGEALADGLTGSTLVRLRSGHFPMHEQPDAFVAALGAFLSRAR